MPPEFAKGLPSAVAGKLLPNLIHRLGWLLFLLLTAALAALQAWRTLRFARMENRMGALIGMAATRALALQCALFYLTSFTSSRRSYAHPCSPTETPHC